MRNVTMVLAFVYLLIVIEATTTKETCSRQRVALIVNRENCRPTRLLTYSCSGQCRSYTMVQGGSRPMIERHCQCCQEMGEADHRVPLLCRDTVTMRPVMAMTIVKYPTSCLCRPCGAEAEPEPLEISEISKTSVLPIGIRSIGKRHDRNSFLKRDAYPPTGSSELKPARKNDDPTMDFSDDNKDYIEMSDIDGEYVEE